MAKDSSLVLNLGLLYIWDMAMVIDGHLTMKFSRPGERHQQFHYQLSILEVTLFAQFHLLHARAILDRYLLF